jgi:hypothetical protein
LELKSIGPLDLKNGETWILKLLMKLCLEKWFRSSM